MTYPKPRNGIGTAGFVCGLVGFTGGLILALSGLILSLMTACIYVEHH
jgi:hypothetical protein